MRHARVRTSPLGAPAAFRRVRLLKRSGRLAVVRDDGPECFIVHLPTGLRCHGDLEQMTRRQAMAALLLLTSVGDWDWTDPWAVVEMSEEHNRSLADFCVAVGEMVRS